MKFLFMTGPLYPQTGNNANLLGKLIPYFLSVGHEVHLFSAAFGYRENELPAEFFGVPVHWATDQKHDWKRKLLYPAVSKLIDPSGLSDAIQVQILQREMKTVCNAYFFDAVVSTSEPFPMACTASQLQHVKKALYIMDPPECVLDYLGTQYRNKMLPLVLKRHNALITTPFIAGALRAQALPFPQKLRMVGFPMITENPSPKKQKDHGVIRLLFCGWLYSHIRSPQYFLDIVSRLDERFEVTFMGRECEKLQERFQIETRAKITTLPNQPYDIALKAMEEADVLINIGNAVPVHMPSKTLEYINTGKPMVNFYKFTDCPTLYYTKRYPLALNLYEEEKDMDAVAFQFVQFCEEYVGKTVDHMWIESEYSDCTPKYIAQKIIESLEK